MRLMRTRSTQDSLVDAAGQLSLEGSDLMLRPSAPVYCLDIDPAVLNSTGSSAAAIGGTAASAIGVGVGTASVGMHRGRWGYRSEGFSAVGGNSRRAAGNAADSTAQNATVGPGLVAPADGSATAGAAEATDISPAAAATAPGNFWPGPFAGLHSRNSCSGSSSGGLLTGLNPGLGVGPGGLVVGPTVTSSGSGLRPRPKSSHTAAVESISKKQAILQVRLR